LPVLTRRQVEVWQAVLGFYSVGRPPLNLDDEKFVQLQGAINQHQVVALHYHAYESNRISARDVEPVQLAFVDSAWILHGYCRLRQDYRNFRLDRIDKLTVKRETFAPRLANLRRTRPSGSQLFVRFAPTIVRWVREAQHFTFSKELPEDEDGTVTMVYQITSLGQISRWLLGWGAEMEVLEPPEDREAIAQITAQMAQQHGNP
jgi:predicted DNA-binding transcriptional regulator YafY